MGVKLIECPTLDDSKAQSYLIKLVRELETDLNNVDESQLNSSTYAKLQTGADTDLKLKNYVQISDNLNLMTAGDIKNYIISTADEVTREYTAAIGYEDETLRSDMQEKLDLKANEVDLEAEITRTSSIIQDVDAIKTEVKEEAKIVSNLSDEVSGLSDDVIATQTQVSTLEQTVEGFTTRVENDEAIIANHSTEIDALSTEYVGLNTKVSEVEQTADKINLVVASGTTIEDVVLTTGAISSIEDQIDLSDNATIQDLEEKTTANIALSADSIINTVSENYYLKTDAEALAESISTQFTQTANSFEMMFSTLKEYVDNADGVEDAKIATIQKYITFKDGCIILSAEDSNITVEISQDGIYFKNGDNNVAYMTENQLFITENTTTDTLNLGNFAFKVGTKGNLTFNKVKS